MCCHELRLRFAHGQEIPLGLQEYAPTILFSTSREAMTHLFEILTPLFGSKSEKGKQHPSPERVGNAKLRQGVGTV